MWVYEGKCWKGVSIKLLRLGTALHTIKLSPQNSFGESLTKKQVQC